MERRSLMCCCLAFAAIVAGVSGLWLFVVEGFNRDSGRAVEGAAGKYKLLRPAFFGNLSSDGAWAKRGSERLAQLLYPDPGMPDIVFAISTQSSRAHFIRASAAARQAGLRLYVAVEEGGNVPNSSSTETWATFPDDNPRRSLYAGDSRLAMVPFLAYHAYGESFKWMLYGDDDTLFFPAAVENVVKGLDPDQPIFLSDNHWYRHTAGGKEHGFHPHRHAPLCLPNASVASADRLRQLGYNVAAACPCTPEVVCEAIKEGNSALRGCGSPLFSHHGGAGALISIGLLRSINFQNYHRCVRRTHAPGGDAFLVECLWQQGVAPSTPDPLWHPLRLQMFSPAPEELHTDEYLLYKASHVMANLLASAAGVCHELCQLELRHTVSLHIRARSMGASDKGAAIFIMAFSLLAERVWKSKFAPSQREDLDEQAAAIIREVEASMDVGLHQLQLLGTAIQGFHSNTSATNMEDVAELKTVSGKIGILDRMTAGAARAVALGILRGIRTRVQPLATWGNFLYDIHDC